MNLAKWFKSLFKDDSNSLTNLLLLQRKEHQARLFVMEGEIKNLNAEILALGSESAMGNEIRVLKTIIESMNDGSGSGRSTYTDSQISRLKQENDILKMQVGREDLLRDNYFLEREKTKAQASDIFTILCKAARYKRKFKEMTKGDFETIAMD